MGKGRLRKLFTNDEIRNALESTANGSGYNHTAAARELTKLGRGKVARTTVRYWQKHLDFKKKDGKPYVGTTVLDREIRESIKLRQPTAEDFESDVSRGSSERILIIPDLHAPYEHQDALPFLVAVREKYCPTRVVNLGDETDGHALSMHDSDPNLDAAGAELYKARTFLGKLEKEFPVMDIMHSNHGSLVYRRAFKSGIPVEYIKSYREVLFPNGGGQGWQWLDKLRLKLPNGEDVIFQHQSSGDTLANAAHERASIVEGHQHGRFEIQYRASTSALYFSLISGCLIDHNALAFAYGKLFPKKPIIGCSLLIDGVPRLVPMDMDSNGRWTGILHG